MAPKRTIVIVVAVVVGLVAAVLVYLFLHDAQSKAYANAKLVPAYVVTTPIPSGLNATNAVNGGYLTKKDIPAEVRPTTAITDLDQLSGMQAASSYAKGQILVLGMFESPSQTATASSTSHLIPAGDVAISISVDQIHGAGGFPVPGDKVDILVNNNGAESYLLQNVTVLAVGQNTTSQTTSVQTTSGQSPPTTTPVADSGQFTFAVDPASAQRIAFAQTTGLDIYLALVPAGNQPVFISPTNTGNILNGPLVPAKS